MILGRLPETETLEGEGDHDQSTIGVKRQQPLLLPVAFCDLGFTVGSHERPSVESISTIYDDQHAGTVRMVIQLTIDGLSAAQYPGVGSLAMPLAPISHHRHENRFF